MTVLVSLFAGVYARRRERIARLWMFGWVAIEIHFAGAVLFSYTLIGRTAALWLAYSTLLAAAAAFFLSVSQGTRRRASRAVFWGLLFVPALGYWTCLVMGLKGPWIYRCLLAVLVCAGAVLALDGRRGGAWEDAWRSQWGRLRCCEPDGWRPDRYTGWT